MAEKSCRYAGGTAQSALAGRKVRAGPHDTPGDFDVQENDSVAASGQVPATAFILGPPRSGTSLMYKVLCLHPDTSYISNWAARVPSRPELAAVNRIARRKADYRQQSWFDQEGNAYVYGARRSMIRRAFPKPVEGEPIYTSCGINKAGESTDRDRSIALLRRRIAQIHSFGGGGTHFVNKRVANNRRVPLLKEAFPDAKFVAVVRDGRAVANSLSRVDWWPTELVWWYGNTPRQWAANGGDPWELCARDWVHELAAMEAGLAEVDDDKKLLVRYEDLIDDPIDCLTNIASFVGLAPSPVWQERLTQLTFPNRNVAWRDQIPAEAVEVITEIQRDSLERYGYPT